MSGEEMWWERKIAKPAESEPESEPEFGSEPESEYESYTLSESDSDTDVVVKQERMARLFEPDTKHTTEEKVLLGLHIVHCRQFTEYDPKQNDFVCTCFCHFNIAFFDLDEESDAPHGLPLQVQTYSDWCEMADASVNVISLKIIRSDVGYPINVFGTVLARDEVDYKCVYLFRRERDDPQCITKSRNMLTLTGPRRGFVISDSMFFEINLKIKGDQTSDDKDFSKGVIRHWRVPFDRRPMITHLLSSWRSIVELALSPITNPVAASLKVNILSGPCDVPFKSKVTARTIGNIENPIILYEYDNKVTWNHILIEDDGAIVLTRNLVAVPVPSHTVDDDEEILLNVSFIAGNGKDERTSVTLSYPEEEKVCNHGCYELLVKVCWTGIQDVPMRGDILRRWTLVPAGVLAPAVL
ncbi:uncharacterized protein LOC100825793 isoform X2 [Brachypodium distachyon]|nr:uncharacterized protein LOC100825793 isoform X2 [Brachypodium distachyon]|eukprot:XP_010234482.1 uncharacterized protein LOC100825793 isoform X2 [Brachypodium distachyon]